MNSIITNKTRNLLNSKKSVKFTLWKTIQNRTDI